MGGEMGMPARARRALLIGLAGLSYQAASPLLEQGCMPNLAGLLREGAFCEKALSPFPPQAGPAWATLATGAWPGTHGVTGNSYHVSGEPVSVGHDGLRSDAVLAEMLWEAVVRAGGRAAVMNYAGSWPPRHPDIVMIDGVGQSHRDKSSLQLSRSQLFSTEIYPDGKLLELAPARDWISLPESTQPPLEFLMEYRPESERFPGLVGALETPMRQGAPIELWGLVFARGDAGYDSVAVCAGKSVRHVWQVFTPGAWSDSLEGDFKFGDRVYRGSFVITLDWLDPLTGAFALYISSVYPIDGFTQPATLGRRLVDLYGAYISPPGLSEYALGWFSAGRRRLMQQLEYQDEWLTGAGRYLLDSQEWDLFVLQSRSLEYALCAAGCQRVDDSAEDGSMDPGIAQDVVARSYSSLDRLVGELSVAAGEDTLLCIVSDRGYPVIPGRSFSVNHALAQAGLMTYEYPQSEHFHGPVDPARTLAQEGWPASVYVNLAGRDPGGIVPPERYEEVRDMIIAALEEYRDLETGRNPFAMIIRQEDARPLGLYANHSRDIGDVVYALLPEFDGGKGMHLPTAVIGGQSTRPFMLFHGPGVKPGFTLSRETSLADVVPTIVAALGWQLPAQAEGSALQRLFDYR
jgi:predicted AlkP superfamily phosphohydrolase/phosphomutase